MPWSDNSWLAIITGFPVFLLRLFTHPRSVVRGLDWSQPGTLERIALYCAAICAILTLAFGSDRVMAEKERPLLRSFKGVIMRAHDRSWAAREGAEPESGFSVPYLQPVYTALRIDLGEAKRLWDTLLTHGFLAYAFLAGALGIAAVARLRMLRYGLSWEQAIGTGLLAYVSGASCAALSMVPLGLLFICRHCGVRLALFILLNLAAWFYSGYYTLGDLGERPSGAALLLRSLGYGLLHYLLVYIVFFVLILCVIPI